MRFYPPPLLKLVIFSGAIFAFSCQKDTFEREFEPKTFIQECTDEFNAMSNSFDSPSIESKGSKGGHPLSGIYKQPVWSSAYVKNISLGHAAVIPLSFSESIYNKLGKKDKAIPLEQLSYLMMYRNGNGKMVAEFVIVTPTAEYVDEGFPNGKPFSGTIEVYDWQLNHQRGYRFTSDGQILYLDKPQFTFISEKERENQGSHKYEQQDCVITDWYSCPGYATTVTSECTYLYTEIVCSSTGGGGTGDGGGSGVVYDPGSPNPGDYPTGGSIDNTTPNNPNDPTDPPPGSLGSNPCKGDPLVTMKICPTESGSVVGGTYGWTRKNVDKSPKFHDGFDLYAEPNTPVYSPWDNGIVVSPLVGNLPTNYYNATSYGNYVWVEYTVNGQKIRMRFAHLNTANVKVGDRVSHSTVLGLSGKTGNANKYNIQPHVHIQVRYFDSATGKWVESRSGSTFTEHAKCNPDHYLPSKFNYTTGEQIYSPCDTQN